MDKLPTWVLMLLIAASVSTCTVITLASKGDDRREIADVCQKAVPKPADILAYWQTRGVIMNIRHRDQTAVVEVRTQRWADISLARKKSIAIAAYCEAKGPDGRGFARIEGGLQEDLGSVVDGTWMR